jgi:hypothetical protein
LTLTFFSTWRSIAPHAAEAARVLGLVQSGKAEGLVAWHTISNLYYLLSAGHDRKKALEFIRDLARLVEVASADDEVLNVALSLQMRDFEDAMQVACALAGGAEAIVTRNPRDFRASPIRAIAPRDFRV